MTLTVNEVQTLLETLRKKEQEQAVIADRLASKQQELEDLKAEVEQEYGLSLDELPGALVEAEAELVKQANAAGLGHMLPEGIADAGEDHHTDGVNSQVLKFEEKLEDEGAPNQTGELPESLPKAEVPEPEQGDAYEDDGVEVPDDMFSAEPREESLDDLLADL